MRKFFIIGFSILLVFDTLAQVSFKLAGINTQPDLNWDWVRACYF